MQSMGELPHAEAHTFQDSFEACQGDYSRSVGHPRRIRLVPTIDPIILRSKM